jgi:chemotaxis protein histidine kinase CheA
VSEDDEIIRASQQESREDPHTLQRSLVELTRGAEDLLDRLRSGTLAPDAAITTSLVGLVDATRAVLVEIQASGEAAQDRHRNTIAALAAHVRPASPEASAPQDDEASRELDEPSLLLATGHGGAHLAVSLAAVQRLEQFAPEQLQRSGEIDVIRYGDAFLPVLWLADLLSDARHGRGDPQTPRAEHAQTIVCESSVGPLGLVVERIEDVVPQPRVPSQPSSRPGVAGRFVIDDRVTELLDIEALVTAARDRGQSL